MKQIIQDLKNGETQFIETPSPSLRKGQVLIKTQFSLVSSGTERMLLNFGKAGWIEKARLQPEKVKQVLSKIRTDGFFPALDAVNRKLDNPIPLGYCNAGEIVDVSDDITEFKVGDRVVSNGNHAELVCVDKNLVAKIPYDLSYEEAVFTIIGAISLQGVRLAAPSFGEVIVVQGLGLIGLIAIQILKSNGCRVIGIDRDLQRVKLAESFGVNAVLVSENESGLNEILEMTDQHGADAVLIAASSKSNELVSQAAKFCRKRGRIILIGVVGLELNRSDFYEKELSFQVSCSYGPGRYDEQYEHKGIDYPYAFVRWTVKRNFEAILDALTRKLIDVKSLISEIVEFEQYDKIYSKLTESSAIASLLKYSNEVQIHSKSLKLSNKKFSNNSSIIGIIGSGSFTSGTMLPLLFKLKAPIKSICSNNALSATQLAKKYSIPIVSSDFNELLTDSDTKALIITTRHNTHAELVCEGLKQDKHIFVEKPLCIRESELLEILKTLKNSSGSLMVGYNRRFSPAAELLKETLQSSKVPVQILISMNVGIVPQGHWIQDMEIGGGRILGEACHSIDLASFLAGSLAVEVSALSLGSEGINSDNVSILIKYQNGSTAVLHYHSHGNKNFPKERIEVHQNNLTAVIDNFKSLSFFGGSSRAWSGTQDKGHYLQYQHWLKFIESGGSVPIEIESILNTSRVSFAVLQALKENAVQKVIV